MFLFRCNIAGKPHYLHDGQKFLGAETYRLAQMSMIDHSAKAISVGGLDIVEKSEEELKAEVWDEKISGYHILQVSGGLIPFSAVPIKEKS